MIVHDRSELLTRLLRNLNTIPPEEYRGNQMWELVLQITDFSLKATANMFKSSYSETITVDFICIAQSLGDFESSHQHRE